MRGRVVVALRGKEPGPTLVVVGALHGNEPAGVDALVRLGDRLSAAGGLERGALIGLVGNRSASAVGRRYLDRDLNRIWELPPGESRRLREGRERLALTRALGRIRRTTSGPLHVVDVHTTSGRGPAFTIVPRSPWGRAEADALPVPRVTGVFTSLRGTFGGWLDRHDIPNLTLEAGSHRDLASAERAEAVLRLLAERLGLAGPRWLETDGARARLARESHGLPPLLRVCHRHAITPEDDFRMEPGFSNLQRVRKGERLARDRHGFVEAPEAGWLLLPLYQLQGEDGFLLAQVDGDLDPQMKLGGSLLPNTAQGR
jgi:predicted deacylase